MAIIAASVEASGWVLRLDVSGVPGTFAAYALDPGGTPRVTLSCSHTGFIKSGGQAVAGSLVRALVATKPLRLPVNPVTPTTPVIDETDLGGGIVRVRIALSEHVYATDSGLSLAVLAGWRTGEPAASGIAVTNNSTIVAPMPIMRWALLPYGVTTGSFTLALLVVSHHPVGLDPVAGVRFSITDGTTVKTVWTTQLATDTSYGDNLRCYTASVNPAIATALTAGLLRCDAEVYPWLGAMRTTDPAGTRSMTTLRTDGFSVDAASPWVIGYDPAGTRYGQQFAFVDPVNGTTTATAGMVATTLAAARAVAPASRPRDINTALQAGYLVNRTLAAANGQAAQSRSVDGMQIVLAAGTHAVGATAVTTGLATAEIPVRLVGDPANADPRNNCLLPTGANAISRISRLMLQTMTAQIGVNGFGSAVVYALADNATFAGKPGSEASTTAPFTASAVAGTWNMGLARTRWWKTASTIGGGNTRPAFMRACEHSRGTSHGLFAVKNRLISAAEDGFVGTTVFTAFSGWPSATLAGQVEDHIVAFNDIRNLRGRAWGPQALPAATAGTPNPSFRRQAFIGNLCERIGTDPQPLYSLGEDASATMSYNIIEGNSFIGDRSNTLYSDPLPTTIAETNTQLNQAFVNRVANNAFDWLPTKHDDFNDPQSSTLRGTANGYRPQMTAAWSMLYGVGHEANVDTRRATAVAPGNFALEYSGPRSLAGYSGAFSPLYTSDQSLLGSGSGGGNYRPLPGSPLIGRALRGNSDVDADGVLRSAPFAAGAYLDVGVTLVPAGARSPHTAAPAAVNWTGAIAPLGGRLAMSVSSTVAQPLLLPASTVGVVRGGTTVLAWNGTLLPAAARTPVSDNGPPLAWSGAVQPAHMMVAHNAAVTRLDIVFTLLPMPATAPLASTAASLMPGAPAAIAAADASHPVRSSSPLLFAPGGEGIATLIVGADPRTLIPNRN